MIMHSSSAINKKSSKYDSFRYDIYFFNLKENKHESLNNVEDKVQSIFQEVSNEVLNIKIASAVTEILNF